MISLNRPYDIPIKDCLKKNGWGDRHLHITYASREGLNLIYQKLYFEKGSLRVAVSPLTCFIALYPIVTNGHIPVFVDIDPYTLNMSESELEYQQNVQVLQTIYLGGNPMQMNRVMKWADRNNVIVIEDCAQALGSTFNDQWLGTFGDYAVASAVKNLYSPVGGILASRVAYTWSNSQPVSAAVIRYKYFKRWLEQQTTSGIRVWNALYSMLLKVKEYKEAKSGTMVHGLSEKEEKNIYALFANYTKIQSERRNKAEKLLRLIDTTKYRIQEEPEGGNSNRNRIILVSKYCNAKDIIHDLREKGIAANNLTQNYIHSYQQHINTDELLSKYYTNTLARYEELFPHVVTIPCSPALSNKEIDYIAHNINAI